MGQEGDATTVAWDERIQWILDEYEDGSRRAMGRKVGLSGQAISAWARGETKPSGEGLAAIIQTYPELRARWLLTGNGVPRIAAAGRGGLTDGADGDDGLDAGSNSSSNSESERSATLERAYEAGRRDAVMEMIEMLGELTSVP